MCGGVGGGRGVTYCQSALLRASLHIVSASSRGGRASRIRFRILRSTIHGKGNVELSCRMSDPTSGGVVARPPEASCRLPAAPGIIVATVRLLRVSESTDSCSPSSPC